MTFSRNRRSPVVAGEKDDIVFINGSVGEGWEVEGWRRRTGRYFRYGATAPVVRM